MRNFINFLTRILQFFVPQRFASFLNYETVSYLFFGGLTTVIGFATYAFFIYFAGFTAAIATAISSVLAIIFAFITNKIFVFESPSFRPAVLFAEIAKFGVSRAFTMLIEVLVIALLVDRWGFNALLMRLVTLVVIQVIGNYALSKWIVFARSSDD